MTPNAQLEVRGLRLVTAALVTVAALVLAVAEPFATVPPSTKASVVDGAVRRAEILAREHNWVDRRITYTQTGSTTRTTT